MAGQIRLVPLRSPPPTQEIQTMTDSIRITDVTITAEQKEFLNQLRRSGVVNMFGAGPYIAEEFGLTSSQARTVLVQWMEGFEAAATTTTTDS